MADSHVFPTNHAKEMNQNPPAHTYAAQPTAARLVQSIHPLLRRRVVAYRLGISVPSFDRLRADPQSGFPAAVKLSAQAQALLWHPHEIDAWIATRQRASH